MFPSTSLRTKLIALVSVILIAGFAATSFLNYQVSKGALRTTVLENELPLSSNNIYSEIQADLLRPVFVSSLMAHDTFLRDWVLDGEQDPTRIIRYLNEIRGKYDTFTAYFISNRTHRYYHFKGVDRTLSEDNPEDGWFFHARDTAEPYEVNVDFNYQQDRSITIFINYRVLDYDGNFIGVTGVGLGLDSVARLVKEYQESFRRNVYFVDEQGLIRVHGEQGVAGETNIRDIDGLSAIAGDVLASERGSYSYKTQDDTVLLTTRYIPELKWHLFIELPESQALADMREGFLRNLAIAPLVILATIILIAYTINIFQRRLEDMAVTDKLTGLGNRQSFDMAVDLAIKRFKRDEKPLSLIILDIDWFKKINDTLGHLAGDEAIKRVGEIASQNVRESDVVCRWGGEEFAILANDCNAQQARALAQKVRTAIAEENLFEEHPELNLTASAGVTQAHVSDTANDLLQRADTALYRAKDLGRDRIEME